MFKMTFSTDNAAFEDSGVEIARILREWADRIEDGSEPANYLVFDSNGNRIGTVKWG